MIARGLRFRAPVLWLLLPLLTGVVAGRLAPTLPLAVFVLPAFVLLVAAVLFSDRPVLWSLLLTVGMILAGAGYYQFKRARIEACDHWPARELNLQLRIDRTYAPSADLRRLTGLAQVVSTGPLATELRGQRVYFSLRRAPADPPLIRSSILTAIGVIEATPLHPPEGSFDEMLANAGVNFRFTRARLLTRDQPPTRFQTFCHAAQEQFAQTLGRGLEKHPDLVGLLRAMLLGQKSDLSDEQNQRFMRSGTMHLFVISGLHIGVIALVIHAFAALARAPRLAGFLLSTLALWLYVEITGGAPSAYRAFAMVVCVKAAFTFRRPMNPLASLGLGACLALLVDPMQAFSASYQMSYAIVASLLLLGGPLADTWLERWSLCRSLPPVSWRWHHHALVAIHRALLSAVAVGLASSLVGAVTGIIYFKLFTPGAIAANLLLFPIASIVVASGFLSVVCGLFGLTPLSNLFNHGSGLVLWFIDHGIAALVRLPGMYWKAQFVAPWIGFAGCALLVALMLAGYATRWERRTGGYWPPFILVALLLIFGVNFP